MKQAQPVNRELVSALADGQLQGEEFAQVVAELLESDDSVADWHAYHVVGDALRFGDLAACNSDLAFVVRFRKHLTTSEWATPVQRPGFSVDAGSPAGTILPGATDGHQTASVGRKAANDSIMRWKFFSAIASLAAVAAIGWNMADGGLAPQSGSQLAIVPDAGIGPAGPAVMLRDARLDELLAAHKQFGGTSALQMPAGFLRNATFENSQR